MTKKIALIKGKYVRVICIMYMYVRRNIWPAMDIPSIYW